MVNYLTFSSPRNKIFSLKRMYRIVCQTSEKDPTLESLILFGAMRRDVNKLKKHFI